MTDSGLTGTPPVNDAGGDYQPRAGHAASYTMEGRLERVLVLQTEMLEEQTRLLHKIVDLLTRTEPFKPDTAS